MGIEQSGRTDTRTEDTDETPVPERPPGPPPDRLGQSGFPSRLESRRAAREAQEARAAELESRGATPPESGTEQRDEPEEEAAEPSPAESADEWQDAGEPEDGTQHGAANTDDPNAEADTEQLGVGQGEEAEPFSAEAAVEEPDTSREAEAVDDSHDPGDDKPEAGEVERPDGPGEDAQEAGDQEAGKTTPQPPDERDRLETRDDRRLPQQDGRLSGTDRPAPEVVAGQTLQAEPQSGLMDQASQDASGPVPTEQPEGPSGAQPPNEDEIRQTADGQFRDAEPREQSDMPGNGIAWPLEPEEGVTRWASPVVRVGERSPATQVENRDRNAEGRPETPAATDDETDEYRRLPDRAPAGTPDRGDPIPPDDDPADRNPDPEDGRRSRWENYDRVNTAFDATKKILKGVEDLQVKPPPTGRAEVRSSTTVHAPDTQVGNPADTIGNAIILTSVLAGWVLQKYRKLESSRRSQYADN